MLEPAEATLGAAVITAIGAMIAAILGRARKNRDERAKAEAEKSSPPNVTIQPTYPPLPAQANALHGYDVTVQIPVGKNYVDEHTGVIVAVDTVVSSNDPFAKLRVTLPQRDLEYKYARHGDNYRFTCTRGNFLLIVIDVDGASKVVTIRVKPDASPDADVRDDGLESL